MAPNVLILVLDSKILLTPLIYSGTVKPVSLIEEMGSSLS